MAGVYQFNVVLNYKNATVGQYLQVFLRSGGGDMSRAEIRAPQSDGEVTISIVHKTSGGPVWVELWSYYGFEMSRFTSSFSGALLYQN